MRQNARFVHVSRHRPKRTVTPTVAVQAAPARITRPVRVFDRALGRTFPTRAEVDQAFRDARRGET